MLSHFRKFYHSPSARIVFLETVRVLARRLLSGRVPLCYAFDPILADVCIVYTIARVVELEIVLGASQTMVY